MKKKLSLALALFMLIAAIAVCAVPTVYAEDENAGMWTTMGKASQYDEDYIGDMTSVPGYEYTQDGFSMIAADWSTSTPFATLQSKVPVDLKQGVYMEVRVDDFSYDAGDKWFNFNIWDSVNLEPGEGMGKYGEGVQTLLRPNATGPVADDPETEAIEGGSVGTIAWYTEAFLFSGSSSIAEDNRTVVDDNGTIKDIFTLEITWDSYYRTYVVDINGSNAPEKVIDYMNEKYADGMAYLGFTMHNSNMGGTASATVTKFGTSRETSAVPYGVDYQEPENYDNFYAEIMDPDNIPKGQPAVFMTGDIEGSDLKGISDAYGTIVETTDNNTIRMTATSNTAISGVLSVDNEISYDIKDFPIVMCMTKNWCTCKKEAHSDCLALEAMNAYVLIGDDKAPAPNNKYPGDLDICYNPTIIGEENYLYFWADLSTMEKEGRFNGVRFDAVACDLVTPGFNSFEMLWTGLFRTEEEAEQYALDYLEDLQSIADSANGMWNTMGSAAESQPDYYDDKRSIAGYEYTEDGFSTIPADWSTSTPYVTIQSKRMIDLKAGVFMEVRIDDYSYDASDKWFNFSIWDSVNLEPGDGMGRYGEGVQTLLRPRTGALEDGMGSVSHVAWYSQSFTSSGTSMIDEANRTTVDDDGVLKDVFALEITWDSYNRTYVVTINGSAAPQKIIDYMNEKYADGMAYLGFTMHNSNKGGIASATITRFGNSRSDATRPLGTDWKPAINYDNSYAPIADPSTVRDGNPAIFMTGDTRKSDLKNTPVSSTGSFIEITEKGNIKVTSYNSVADFGVLRVDNDKSYDVADFPVVMCLVKNLCTCDVTSHTKCRALEEMNAYVLVGEDRNPAPHNKVPGALDLCFDPIIIGNDSYLYFWVDLSELGMAGRFNGVRFDAMNIDLVHEGRNTFEMLWTGLFRSEDEAESFALSYLEAIDNGTLPDIGGDDETDTTETTEPEETETTEKAETEGTETTQTVETETSGNNDAESGEIVTTDVVDISEAETTQTVTESEIWESYSETEESELEDTEEESEKKEHPEEEYFNVEDYLNFGGCLGSVGFGSAVIVITSILGAGAFIKRKKDE